MEKKKNRKKKWRDVRNALVMTLLMVAMMSTATYAWFTLSSSPTVTGMQMVASSGSGLVVSDKASGTFYNAMKLPQDANNMNVGDDGNYLLRLVPVTLQNLNGDLGFSLPQYSEGDVTALEDKVRTDADLAGYVAKYTYYIKSESGEVGVGIIAGSAEQSNASGVTDANEATASGTFVRQIGVATGETDPDTALQNATASVRIGLIVSDATATTLDFSTMKIIEPNENLSFTGATSSADDTRADKTSPLSTNVVFGADGTISDGGLVGSDGTESTTTSEKLFEVGEDAKKVTMFVWLEGTDEQCVDQIKADQIEAQIQFTVVENIATTTGN